MIDVASWHRERLITQALANVKASLRTSGSDFQTVRDERDGRPSNETGSAGLCINGKPRHTVSRNSRCFTNRRPAAFGHIKRIAATLGQTRYRLRS